MIHIENVSFSGIINPRAQELVWEQLKPITCQFEWGKSTLLNGELGKGGWALSWIIGGKIKDYAGAIWIDDRPYSRQMRKELVWCVRGDELKRFKLFGLTVRESIRFGLKRGKRELFQTEQDFINKFHLSPERYNRPQKFLSYEGWRASCAIGLANGKSIFCFIYTPPEYIYENADGLFSHLLQTLTQTGAMVIVPSHITGVATKMFDHVITLD